MVRTFIVQVGFNPFILVLRTSFFSLVERWWDQTKSTHESVCYAHRFAGTLLPSSLARVGLQRDSQQSWLDWFLGL